MRGGGVAVHRSCSTVSTQVAVRAAKECSEPEREEFQAAVTMQHVPNVCVQPFLME